MLSPRIMSDISLESTNYCIAVLACEVKTGQRWEYVEGINHLSFRLFASYVPWKWPLPKLSSTHQRWAFNQVESVLLKSKLSTVLLYPLHPSLICFIIICRCFCWLSFLQVHLSLCSVYDWSRIHMAAGSGAHICRYSTHWCLMSVFVCN